ncbi:glycogen debranching protein [Rhodococcus sp. NPDC058521]|uniref:glycogen debranching protein n=1 Tax=Rhodococcus sp. NPDC058521 TaxID=3346536 RepID=UPI00364B78B4
MSSHTVHTVSQCSPGTPFPLGATPLDHGGAAATQFAVHAPDADGVDVCLISKSGGQKRIPLTQHTYGIWHGIVEGVGPGQRYGFRARGEWNPGRGLRTNPAKLLLDPWGKRVTGRLGDGRALLPYDDDPFGAPSTVDSLGHVPVSVVVPGSARTSGPRLETPWEETVIRELHVGSYTARHPNVPASYRGTYLGLAEPTVIGHLIHLGVTAVELLPVHAFLSEQTVRERGMRNHWGYSPASFFAPHPGYASVRGHEITEFHTMVDALHAAGIEVILDVVYNRTCEQGVDGISIGWRGLDAPGYYLLDDNGYDIDLTGCGNTIDAHSPIAIRMILDSLRYWAGDMGVDGFRFDLAAALGRRGGGEFDRAASLFAAISADPLLARCKIIAEPWDATKAGYQLGNFDRAWSEWNDSYRDAMRRFWKGETGVREIASRISGSEDHFTGRRPWASINYVTSHDGFTAADLVSHEGSHQRAHVRALLAGVALSTGTPMFAAGDELGRHDLTAFLGRALALRRAAPALRQAEFFEGRDNTTGHPALVFFDADGTEMDDGSWNDESSRTLQMWVDGSDVRSRTADGRELTDDSWLLVFHAGGPATVRLGCPERFYGTFRAEFDSTTPDGAPSTIVSDATVSVDGPTLLAFRGVG